LTCAIFLRRKTLEARNLYFDTQWRDLGDVYWVMDMINKGTRTAVLDYYTSAFYETGDNMNLKPNAVRERQLKAETTPPWIKKTRSIYLLLHRLRMIKRGAYTQKPFDFSLYTPASPDRRVTRHVPHPTGLWPNR
jgi:hypothetical protein